ncbi:MAG TPA: A/G-specific adenine glycosylase, partial [Rhodocyclaceae bacterium]|nr:A/G-specific adenine glycosylase [Rhodocyclaceae bacterium]
HWAGLGYYARARNLHRCAQRVVSDFGGVFPTGVDELASLPGIGRSTAAAIAVFAGGARAAILDGNVKRVLTRCFGIAGFPGATAVDRELWALAERLLPATGVEAYTQGLMDLGASLCARRKPQCGACPLAAFCVARRDGRTAELPTAKPRQAIPLRHSRVLLLVHQGRVLLSARPPVGLWGGLWTLPEVPEASSPEAAARQLGCVVGDWQTLPPLRHAFTHFRLEITAHRGCVTRFEAAGVAEPDDRRWLALDAIDQAPLPTPVLKLLRGVAPASS